MSHPECAACTHYQGGSESEVYLAPLRNLVADAEFVCQELVGTERVTRSSLPLETAERSGQTP